MSTSTAQPPITGVDAERIWDLGYELLGLRGVTPYCDIWQIRRRGSNLHFSWKQIRKEWESNPQARQAMENEAAVATMVRSAYLPHILDMHTEHSPYYLLADWFAGESLERWLFRYGPMPARMALWIGRQCAQALDDLLQAGLIHGDLRKSNVLIDSSGVVQLSEISTARRAPGLSGESLESKDSIEAGAVSDKGISLGTDRRRGPVAVLKDCHSLGLILFECLTGRSPFDSAAEIDLLDSQLEESFLDVRRFQPGIDGPIAEFVASLLTREARSRPTNPADIVDRLTELELCEFVR